MSSDVEDFRRDRAERLADLASNKTIEDKSRALFKDLIALKYHYNFEWLGLPIMQLPQDLMALQEIIWSLKPGVIVETGVARGGSAVFYASMLALSGGDGVVVGVDIDIRPHNRDAIAAHPLADRIRLIEGSSTDPETVAAVQRAADGRGPVLVILDSNHTHAHVLAELRAYSPLVRAGAYIVVFDSVIDILPPALSADRPWGPGDNPRTAIHAFLEETDRFEIDRTMEAKLQLTCCVDGFLKCVA